MSPHPVYTDIENIISYCSWSKYFDNKYEFPGQALIFIYIDHPGECLLNSTNIAVISSSYGMILRFWWNIVLVEFSFLFRFYLDYAVAKSVQELILWMTRLVTLKVPLSLAIVHFISAREPEHVLVDRKNCSLPEYSSILSKNVHQDLLTEVYAPELLESC